MPAPPRDHHASTATSTGASATQWPYSPASTASFHGAQSGDLTAVSEPSAASDEGESEKEPAKHRIGSPQKGRRTHKTVLANSVRRLDQLLANLGYCSRPRGPRVGRERLGDRARRTRRFRREGSARRRARRRRAARSSGWIAARAPQTARPGLLARLARRPECLLGAARTLASAQSDVTSVGRLDKDTSGLLLLTDQSPLVHRLTSPKPRCRKSIARRSIGISHRTCSRCCERHAATRRRETGPARPRN